MDTDQEAPTSISGEQFTNYYLKRFRKMVELNRILYKNLKGGVYVESETNEYAIYTNTYTYI